MSTSRAWPLFSKRVRLLEAPRWAGTRRGLHYQERPKTDSGGRFRSIPLLTSIAFTSVASASLGWWAHEHIEVRTISAPVNLRRLPSSEKSRVMKDREAAQRFLIQRYPPDEYIIFLDMYLPGDCYDDADSPSADDQGNDVDRILTSPAVLYRVAKVTDKGKTVAVLIYAHPNVMGRLPLFVWRTQMLQRSMDFKGGFFMHAGERI